MPPDRDSDATEMTLTEAATLYTVSGATLRRLVTAGLLPAYKVNGSRGQEWRVAASAIEQAGYAPRAIDLNEAEVPRAEVRRLTAAALATERARSARLDGQLGYALLTIGRLRGRLQEAGIDPNELFGAELGHNA